MWENKPWPAAGMDRALVGLSNDAPCPPARALCCIVEGQWPIAPTSSAILNPRAAEGIHHR
jgi:hypothetical protein